MMLGIADSFSDLASVAVVPLGISKFNTEAAMRVHTGGSPQRAVGGTPMANALRTTCRSQNGLRCR